MAKYTGVTQNEDGSWLYRIKIKLPNGSIKDTRIRKDSRGNPFLTARQAFEAKKEHEAKIRANPEENLPNHKKVTLSSVYENYLNTEAKTKAPATLRKQDSMWKNHILKVFGDRDIDSITMVELQEFLFKLYQEYSYKYTQGFLKFFYLLFGHADRMEVISSEKYNRMFVNRNKRLTMPKKMQSDLESEEQGAVIYTEDELKLIESIFESENGNLLLAFKLGLYAGLRISECFGLRWQDIDWNAKTMRISRQMHYIDGEIRLCPVKTLTSVRTIIIPDKLYEELEFRYSLQADRKKKLENAYRNTERVYDELTNTWIQGGDFVNRKENGELLTVNSMKYWAKKINPELRKLAEKAAKFKTFGSDEDIVVVKAKEFKYHNLRHTYATNCAAVNMSLTMLMSMMGHKKVDTTRKYYINTDNESMIDRTRKLLNEMYLYNEK